MSKRPSRTNNTAVLANSRRKRLLVVLTLALICVVGTSILAQVTSRRKSKRDSGEVSAMSLLPASPSKEYVYAGSRLISTLEPTASVNGDNAQFVSMCVNQFQNPCWPIIGSAFNIAGASYAVTVTMLNTGTTTWSSGTYKLGSQNPANNVTWGTSRVSLPAPQVAPGQYVTFAFSATKPTSLPPGGFFNYQWQMVQDGGVGFFGERTNNGRVASGTSLPSPPPANDAVFVSETVPSLMLAGKSYPISITMNNAGTNTWTAAGNYNLGSQIPQDNVSWGTNRVALPASVAPGANVTFNFNVTAPATPGVYNFQWMMVQDGVGWFGNLTAPLSIAVNKKAALGYLDFNNDGKSDIGTWSTTDLYWRLDYNLDGVIDAAVHFYNSRGDLPAPADYDGDGKADVAVLRPLAASYYYLDLNRDGIPDYAWRTPVGYNAWPVPGDYDGDGRADPAVFDPGTGNWYVDTGHGGNTTLSVNFGQSGDIPVQADYNRDGRTDFAVFRPSTGQWLIDTNQDGIADIIITFGQNGDKPVPMDYNGDGIADLAVFRPSTGQWFIDTNQDGIADLVVTFGVNGDTPVPNDYNGDGQSDIAVYRPSTGQWFIDTNKDGIADITVTLGGSIPLRVRY